MFISITFKTESCDYYCDMFEVEYISDIVNELKKCWYVYELENVCNYWVSNSIDKELNYEIKETISNFIDELQERELMNKRVDVSLFMQGQYYEEDFKNLHPQEVMKKLGITYTVAVPQSIADMWQFWGCDNVPENLPEFLEVADYGNPRDKYSCLSDSQVDKIVAKYGEHE